MKFEDKRHCILVLKRLHSLNPLNLGESESPTKSFFSHLGLFSKYTTVHASRSLKVSRLIFEHVFQDRNLVIYVSQTSMYSFKRKCD